jgi:hypothetical protein
LIRKIPFDRSVNGSYATNLCTSVAVRERTQLAGRGVATKVHYALTVMRATLSYTLLRVMLFLAAALVLALLGVHGITLLVVALIISSILSIPLLSRLRGRMSASLSRRVDGFHAKLDAGTRAEDTD